VIGLGGCAPSGRSGSRGEVVEIETIVVMGFGYERPWRLGTWDRFAIPRPWSRARGVVSRAIHVPADLSRDDLERQRAGVERLLVRLTDDAEAWAGSRLPRPGETIIRKEPSRHAKQAALLSGPAGVSLDEELSRFGLALTERQSDRPAA
jgi:hypothetical protein